MNLYWHRGTDKYGRPVHYLLDDHGTRGVVVRLPKTAWGSHDGCKYLVNDWTADKTNYAPDAAHGVTYAYSLREGKARLEAIAAGVQA